MNAEQEHFLREELLTLSINGALGRVDIYSESAQKEEDRIDFRRDLRSELKKMVAEYTTEVPEQIHLSNIQSLANRITLKHRGSLKNGRFKIGRAQKALNLYLKYLWCLGFITLPPHCPFDSKIINKLPECSDLKWTSIDAIDAYVRLVEAARKRAALKSLSLSEWELQAWND